jgi:hypothetical protein
MYEPEVAILCGKCRVPVVGFHIGYQSMVRCPKCDETDTLNDARREAGEHTPHQLIQKALTQLTGLRQSLTFRFIEDSRLRRDD